MKYVQKVNTPQFFTDDTAGFIKWNEYKNGKEKLRKYILENEQSYLCIYCESKILANKTSSHLEHIKPKDKYSQLTFKYVNITVSCNGTCHNQEEDNTSNNCGHIKSSDYNDNKFLNPVKLENIREFFKYDFDDCLISPSNKDIEKAKYMITILHLNDGGLPKARDKALKNFINIVNKIKNINIRKEKIKQVLNKENIAFISFLRFKYSTVLNTPLV